MKKRSGPCKLAHGAFGCSLFVFLGPGFYFALNAHAQQAQVGVEAGLFGIVIAVLGLIMAVAARRGLGRLEDKTGTGWANAAFLLSVSGGLVWCSAFGWRLANDMTGFCVASLWEEKQEPTHAIVLWSRGASMEELNRTAKDLARRLERRASEVRVFGMGIKEHRIEVEPRRLESGSLSMEDVRRAFQQQSGCRQ